MATVLTNLGEQYVCDFLSGTDSNLLTQVGWGTGAGTAAKSDTTLFTEASEAKVTGTRSTTGSGATAKFQVVATMTADGAKTITNAGLFTATGLVMVIKGDFTGVTLAASDQIEFTFTLDPS